MCWLDASALPSCSALNVVLFGYSLVPSDCTHTGNAFSHVQLTLEFVQCVLVGGIPFCEGRARDKTNIRNILATLESIDRLSGILFLLTPNQPRDTDAFSYYMSELIRHLHIDASKNT